MWVEHMLVLALDTTGPHCSVALLRDDTLLHSEHRRIGRGHAEVLGVMVREALEGSGTPASAVTRLAVCRGPGSFTGLRVGLSYALGFSLPRGLPVLGVDVTEIAAHGTRGTLAVRLDVRRGEVGWSAFRDGVRTHSFVVESVEVAERRIAELGADSVLSDPVPDMQVLARMAAELEPEAYPAEALYARGPDAKLPGGRSLG